MDCFFLLAHPVYSAKIYRTVELPGIMQLCIMPGTHTGSISLQLQKKTFENLIYKHILILPVENATIIYKYKLWNAMRSVISSGYR